MNVNSNGAKPIYINGVASSSSNYTLPAGSYIAYYDGTNWHFRTDGRITSNTPALTVNDDTLSTTKWVTSKISVLDDEIAEALAQI